MGHYRGKHLQLRFTVEDQGMLPPMAVDRVKRHSSDGTTVLHMFTSKVRPHEEAAATA